MNILKYRKSESNQIELSNASKSRIIAIQKIAELKLKTAVNLHSNDLIGNEVVDSDEAWSKIHKKMIDFLSKLKNNHVAHASAIEMNKRMFKVCCPVQDCGVWISIKRANGGFHLSPFYRHIRCHQEQETSELSSSN